MPFSSRRQTETPRRGSIEGLVYDDDDIRPVAMHMLAIQVLYVCSLSIFPVISLLAANEVFGNYSPKPPLTEDFLCASTTGAIINRMCAFAPLFIFAGYFLVWFQNIMVQWVPRLWANRKLYEMQRDDILMDFEELENDKIFALAVKGWTFGCMWTTVSAFTVMVMVALSKGCEGYVAPA